MTQTFVLNLRLQQFLQLSSLTNKFGDRKLCVSVAERSKAPV